MHLLQHILRRQKCDYSFIPSLSELEHFELEGKRSLWAVNQRLVWLALAVPTEELEVRHEKQGLSQNGVVLLHRLSLNITVRPCLECINKHHSCAAEKFGTHHDISNQRAVLLWIVNDGYARAVDAER